MFKRLQHLRWTVIALVVLFLISIDSIISGEWQVVSRLPTKRSAFSTAVVDDKIYLIGGTLFKDEDGPFGLSTVEVYDPQNNTWEHLADMPTPREGAEAAVVDGKIYVVGGFASIDNRGANIKIFKTVEVYDPQTDIWEQKQDMSQSRLQFGIGVVAGKIYAIGGANFFEDPWRLDYMEAYDPVTDIWIKRMKMPTRRDAIGIAVLNDKIYAIGGYGWPALLQGGPVLATVEEYTPKINRWRIKRDIPNLKTGFSTVVVADEIYLIGGHGGVAFEEYLTTVEIYSPKTERWRESIPMSIGNTPFGAATINGKIYILGSERENGELSPEIEVFDTGFRAVTAAGKLSTHWGELKIQHQRQPQRN